MTEVAGSSRLSDAATSRSVVAGGIRIHYNEVGAGPPIIGIHGGGPGATSWSNFRGNIEALSANNRFIMFDMPGWGRSDYPADAVNHEFIHWMGGVLNDFMDALDIDSADIIGNSMGGQAALGLALRFPHRIKHLVMIGSQPTDTLLFQPLPQEGIASIGRFYGGDGPTIEKMRSIVSSMVFDQRFVTDELVLERFEAAMTPASLEQGARWAKQPRGDYYFEFKNNSVPTLLIWGHDDRGGALEAGLMMLRRFQDARMYIFAKCGHWAQVEHRDEFNRICLDFFAT